MFAKWFLADALLGVSFIVAKRIRHCHRRSAVPSVRSSPSNMQKIAEVDVAGWLPRRVAWPEPSEWMRERLSQVLKDGALIGVMEQVIERYETVPIGANDRVLVHGDVGLHNLALDPATNTVNGIFDYDSAAWADRHHDFRYLLFDVNGEDIAGFRA